MREIINYWVRIFTEEGKEQGQKWWKRKKNLWRRRNARMIKITGKISLYRTFLYDHYNVYEYLLYLSILTKQNHFYYLEEKIIPYQWHQSYQGESKHIKIQYKPLKSPKFATSYDHRRKNDHSFIYDRKAAVKYAERWWNSYDPKFEKFEKNCTNFVSQCLKAGGAPLKGFPNKKQGWWYKDRQWSFSWAVAHSFRWYLSGSIDGLQGYEVETAELLRPGDIICYDFQGDGRWDHTAIVVAKDDSDQPLVNAHSVNSRYRYWTYEDSTAWTDKINYKFYKIGKQ